MPEIQYCLSYEELQASQENKSILSFPLCDMRCIFCNEREFFACVKRRIALAEGKIDICPFISQTHNSMCTLISRNKITQLT